MLVCCWYLGVENVEFIKGFFSKALSKSYSPIFLKKPLTYRSFCFNTIAPIKYLQNSIIFERKFEFFQTFFEVCPSIRVVVSMDISLSVNELLAYWSYNFNPIASLEQQKAEIIFEGKFNNFPSLFPGSGH